MLKITNRRYKDSLGTKLLPLFIGLISYFHVVGFSALNPLNTSWINKGYNADPIQHLLGWYFFRDDIWRVPLGANPNYGLELGTSIVYSDSIPLLAIVFKLIPDFGISEFQYFGFWLLICFVGQSISSFALIKTFTKNYLLCSAGTILVVFMPFFFWRIQAHFALSGQFLITVALLLVFRSRSAKKDLLLRWILLLNICLLVHAYIFAMVFAIWISSFISASKKLNYSYSQILQKILISFCSMTFTGLIIAGYDFSMTNSLTNSSVSYGTYRWNLLSPFVPGETSKIFANLSPGLGNFETYTYLGIGNILVILIATVLYIRSRLVLVHVKEYFWIVGAVIGMALFALTNSLAIGNLRFHIAIPEILNALFSTFYASARFSWPLLYLITLACIIFVVRIFDRKTFLTTFFILLTVLQVVETSPLQTTIASYTHSRDKIASQGFISEEVWKNAKNSYTKLLIIPSSRESFGFPALTYFSYKMGLATNSVYLSRINSDNLNKSRNNVIEALQSGKLKRDTIYVLKREEASNFTRSMNSKSLITESGNLVFIFPQNQS